ncbi:polysaccharide ABC transporter ATP-binding protein [Leeuwenhoekiella polynyae]|uniref:Lipopolysaccharide transport system ATP-binding protein n=1 Tax=Leeuwenhoekiella polynyae TaxID=1550906 RepID=A0A4Q0PE93_9FLAO|nr:polysaccharide ABC transporter ATP-binding protein [Leeuwenhoekiella polynyae]RXG25187.1 lipopolysaccharide transport system ATP-binding protein [Leeuwenhoekiella polynyae]
MSDIILKAENISKQYRLGTVGSGTLRDDFKRNWAKLRGMEDPFLKVGAVNDRSQKSTEDYVWALRDINFEVKQGEVLGIIGKNGAGKSTLLKILSRVTAPTTGVIKSRGRIASLLEVGTGFHHELTGRENIYLNGAILGMQKAEITRKLDEIIAFSGCERYIDTPTKRYSSGMTVRLAFAVAAHLEPEILVVDEVLAVGDAEFQKKAIGKMQDISQGEGRTVLFVSHNMASVRSLCSRGILLENGLVKLRGSIHEVVEGYLSIPNNRSTSKKPNYKWLKIAKIALNNSLKSQELYNGEILKFNIEFQLLKEHQELAFCLCLYDESGGLVVALNTYHKNEDFFKLKKGFHNATIVLDKYILNNGFYIVDFFANDFKGNIYFQLENAISFNIVDDNVRRGEYFKKKWNGSVSLLPEVIILK